ncbi:MAG: hypothetical protein ACK55Z_11835, partial [bacterium]
MQSLQVRDVGPRVDRGRERLILRHPRRAACPAVGRASAGRHPPGVASDDTRPRSCARSLRLGPDRVRVPHRIHARRTARGH